MYTIQFQLAKLLNTIGFKHAAKIIWDRAEVEMKKKNWQTSVFQNAYYVEHGLLANKLKPKNQIIDGLAEEKIYDRAEKFFDIFGFVSLRGFYKNDKIARIDKILNDFRNRSSANKTLYFTPIEHNRDLQDIIITDCLFDVISKIIGPFWYGGSDAAVESKSFPLHRDTFFNPPVIKILIAIQPGMFQVLSGSHHPSDDFARNAGSYVCGWDRPNNLSNGSSSLYFGSQHNVTKVVGYDDSHQNPPLTNIPLNPGDIFVFNQNLVHGLQPINSTVSFVAFSVFPSPENSRKFNMSRREHLDNIIKSTAVMMLVENKLAASKNINVSEIVFPGKAFSETDLKRLIQDRRLRDYFGLFTISETAWHTAMQENSHASWEMLRNNL